MWSQNDYERLPKHPRVWDLVGSVGVARDAGFPTKYDARYFPGQLLWVRETWRADGLMRPGDKASYAADWPDAAVRWTPSIHMPRWASRLTLEVTGVKVERLQDISEEDAKAEGIDCDYSRDPHARPQVACIYDCKALDTPTARKGFNTPTAPGSWAANPWIVAVSFAPHLENIDQLETRKDAQR